MQNMETIIFDIGGSFAHFRAIDTTRENISYPFPPRTAVLGIIGAILGYARNSYLDDSSPLSNCKIGIEILKPIKRNTIKINYIQTRNVIIFNKLKILIPKDPFEILSKDQRGFNMPVSLNVLRDVSFRIYFFSPNIEIMDTFAECLENHQYVFPPYLGHANMLASIEYHGRYNLKTEKAGVYSVATLISTKSLDLSKFVLDQYGFSILYRIPFKLGIINANIFLAKTIDVIFHQGLLKANFLSDQVFQVHPNYIQKPFNIVFLEG